MGMEPIAGRLLSTKMVQELGPSKERVGFDVP